MGNGGQAPSLEGQPCGMNAICCCGKMDFLFCKPCTSLRKHAFCFVHVGIFCFGPAATRVQNKTESSIAVLLNSPKLGIAMSVCRLS